MHYKFNQSVHIAGKDFPRGTHEVSEKVELDPHFLKYVGCGFISEAEVVPVVSLESPQERNERLLNKLVEKGKARSAKLAEVKEPAPSEVSSSDDAEEEKPKGKGGKKKSG